MKEDDGRGRRAAPLEAGLAPSPAIKTDTREALGGWAPGSYLNRCSGCGCTFEGAKNARTCADCAYDGAPYKRVPESVLEKARDLLVEITMADVRGIAHPHGHMREICGWLLKQHQHCEALAGKTAAQQSEGEATLQSSIRSEALEVLQEVYTACLSGDFYADHDEATRLLGTMRRALKEGK